MRQKSYKSFWFLLIDRIFAVGITACKNDTNTCIVFLILFVFLLDLWLQRVVMFITILNVDNGSK